MKLKYRNKIMFTVLFFLLLFIGIGYGAISLSLKTEADAVVAANTWDLTKEIIYKDGNVSSSEVVVTEDTFSFSTTLTDEYDYYNYIVKVENKGTIDATLEELTLSNLTEDQQELINYTVTYTDGTAITIGDIIPAGETAKLLVRVEYKDGLDTYTPVTLDNLTLTINYKIATEEAQNELPTTHTVNFYVLTEDGTYTKTSKLLSIGSILDTMAPTLTGHDFMGWSNEPNGEILYEPGSTYNDNYAIELYTIFELTKYDISFDLNDGTGTFETIIKTHSVDLTLPEEEPSKTGYTFAGWSTNNADIEYQAGDTITSDEDTTLYAMWTANTYSVKYNGNGSTSGSMSNSSHTYDTAKNLTANAFVRKYTVTFNHNYTGSTNTTKTATYTFKNWNTVAGGTGTSYANSASVTNLATSGTFNLYAQWTSASVTYVPTRAGYTFGGWYAEAGCTTSKAGTNGVYTPTANITLYAKWTPITYSVKYNGNGSTSGSMSNSSHTYDVAKTLTANAFAKTGYSFSGWATSSTGSKVYSDKQSVSNLTTTSGATVNLYAVWTINKYTLTFIANGGSVSPTSLTQNYGTSITLPTPTRGGYSFIGWYTASSGGTKRTYTTMPALNENLYAQWNALDSTAPVITISSTTVLAQSVVVSYTVDDSDATLSCSYGTSTQYGSSGTISDGKCTISGLSPSTKYYYKITAVDSAGNVGTATGSATTKQLCSDVSSSCSSSCNSSVSSSCSSSLSSSCSSSCSSSLSSSCSSSLSSSCSSSCSSSLSSSCGSSCSSSLSSYCSYVCSLATSTNVGACISDCMGAQMSSCVSDCMSDGMSSCVSGCISDGMSSCISNGMSSCVSSCVSDGMSSCMSNNMSSCVSSCVSSSGCSGT